jgi:hypothetical protein
MVKCPGFEILTTPLFPRFGRAILRDVHRAVGFVGKADTHSGRMS